MNPAKSQTDQYLKAHGIIHCCKETGWYVAKTGKGFTVFRPTSTHAESDSTYSNLSLAIARCDYMSNRARVNPRPGMAVAR
jgi:hypothetical protein